ncbi:MAG: hypothetical protein AMXMBFR53_17610 [Gemmatimonadota bacterium]
MRALTPEELEKERKASLERRKRQLEEARRDHPLEAYTPTRTLSRAERARLRDDDYVPPRDSGEGA